MRRSHVKLFSLSVAGTFLCALAVGYISARYVPLSVWKPVFPGMLVALSMLSAAVLVRLARNAPITAPAAFDDQDLKRFFDSLEELNRRLFWIFLQAVVASGFHLCLFSGACDGDGDGR